MSIERIILIVVGVFCFVASITNWEWFFKNPRAEFVIRIFRGRNGARVFYLIISLILLYIGFFLSDKQ